MLALPLGGCGDDAVPVPPVVLEGGAVRVSVDLDPFVLRIADATGRVVLETTPGGGSDPYGAPAATVDTPDFLAQSLPGWDGYSANEAPWRRNAAASVVAFGGSSATFAFEASGLAETLAVSIEGARVRLELDAREAPGAASSGALDKSTMAFRSDAGEHFFGLGERFASVDHRGLSLYAWAEEGGLGQGESEPAGPTNPYPNGPSMTYFPVPFLLSSNHYAIHLDTTFRSEMHMASERADAWRLAVNAPSFAATVYVHADPLASIADYTADTGRPMVPASWVFGPRRRVGRGDFVEGVPEPQAMRDHDIAVTGVDDAVHFLPALSQLGHEAELAAWTHALHAGGYKALAYNNPYVAENDDNAAADYAYGKEHGYFVKGPDGEPVLTEFISGKLLTIATIDLTNPDAVAWFQDLLRRTLDSGYDGWMHDFGEYIPRDAVLHDGRRGDEVHDAFPVLSAKAAHDLLEAERPGDYLFFVRSGYAGTQAFVPAVWGGDSEASFDETLGLPSALRGGLTLSMSGVPYWGSDMTGFKCLTGAPYDKEVFLRWVELGSVSPIMMEQNACSNPIADPVKWSLWNDDETIAHYKKYARLHTRLSPYFDALARQAAATGAPITRHAFLVHPDEAAAATVDDAFWLGPSLWISPVVRRGQVDKTGWLPPGRFVDLEDHAVWTGGGVVTLPAPLGKMPLLLATGGIVPMLDQTIDTLAPSDDPSVVTPADVADRLDVLVALETGSAAATTLADGTRLEASLEADDAGDGGLASVSGVAVADCSGCAASGPDGQVTRVRVSGEVTTEESIAFGRLRLSHVGGPARRVRWDVFVVP